METDPRWNQARELFLDLAELPLADQERNLRRLEEEDSELASWVRSLLDKDREDSATQVLSQEPRRLGPYEVLRPLGQGGMGEVFVARRADGEYESEVAIKLLRRGFDNEELVQRFLRERQTLARLNHEYIAKLLDGGRTEEGDPYLVMELVDGRPAHVYAKELDLRERLELFQRIGQAVSHAHEAGFVHRDLKPSNILVRSDGNPRLLDFGIARAHRDATTEVLNQEPLTRTGHRLFTPEYASPEQVRGETPSAACDQFALGVILYEFLCGQRPWTIKDGLHALERRICEEDALPPSRRLRGTARSRISGDLDAIVLQCLAKRPESRYASVAALCDDIERYLSGHTVQAHRTSAAGRLWRLARRSPSWSAAALLAVLAVFALVRWLTTEREVELTREERLAGIETSLEAAQKMRHDGQLEQAKEELERAFTASQAFPGDTSLQAAILSRQAMYASYGQDYQAALDFYERGTALLEQVSDPDPDIVASFLASRASALRRLGSGDECREAYMDAIIYGQEHLEPGNIHRVDPLLGWADEQADLGFYEDAEGTFLDAIAEARDIDENSLILSRALNDYGVFLAESGRLEEANEQYAETVKILEWNHGNSHRSPTLVRMNWATTLYRLGRLEEAEDQLKLVLAASRKLDADPDLRREDDILRVAACQHWLTRLYLDRGEWDQAEARLPEALELRSLHLPGMHLTRTQALHGILLARTHRPAEAVEVLEPLLDERAGDLLNSVRGEALHRLGDALAEVDRANDALERWEQARSIKAVSSPGSPDLSELDKRIQAAK